MDKVETFKLASLDIEIEQINNQTSSLAGPSWLTLLTSKLTRSCKFFDRYQDMN
jgi:hypothetical protein